MNTELIEVKPKYVTGEFLQDRYGITSWALWDWCRKGNFPKGVKLGSRTMRWRLEDVEAWEAERDKEAAA